MISIGIDPGKNGGYALVYNSAAIAFPWDEDAFLAEMKTLSESQEKAACCLEKVSAMPGQGVTSMFTFGQGFGFIQGVLRACGIPFELVPPRKWKAEFGLNSDKAKSITVCRRLFPTVSLLATPRCRKPHDGMAEALLMAEWAKRHMGGMTDGDS